MYQPAHIFPHTTCTFLFLIYISMMCVFWQKLLPVRVYFEAGTAFAHQQG